jgi:hypothetical protein
MSLKDIDCHEKENFKRLVKETHEDDERFKVIEKAYKKKKDELKNAIDNFYYINKVPSTLRFKSEDNKYAFQITKVERTNIIFDEDKLEKKLKVIDKNIVDDVIAKRYEIVDIEGLIKYLKKCGANPKKIKKFLCIEKKVNTQALNEFSELGLVDEASLKDTFQITKGATYFRIGKKRR